MECAVYWHKGKSFIAHTGSGHMVPMDGHPQSGGLNHGPRPMELLLAGLGGCASFDVVLILQRGRHVISGCEVKITSTRAENDPKIFTDIRLHFTVTGRNLKLSVVERAVRLSAEKYCSASIMLGATARMSHSCEVKEE